MTAYTETVAGDTVIVNRTFNEANQLLVSNDIYGLGTTSFIYDNNGNLIEIRPPCCLGAYEYSYDQRNMLVEYVHIPDRPGGDPNPVKYLYDGDGERMQQVVYENGVPVTAITYTNDILGLTQVLVADDGSSKTYNLLGLDLISQDNENQTSILLTDGLGSVRTEMVWSTVESITTYEPYGKLLAHTGASGTVYGYTGEQFDDASGLTYLRARYYNPLYIPVFIQGPFSRLQ